MASEYDIFERTSTGYLIWRDVVRGYENATRRLGELASKSTNEHFLFHLASKQVVARVNECADRTDLHVAARPAGEASAWKTLRPFAAKDGSKRSAA